MDFSALLPLLLSGQNGQNKMDMNTLLPLMMGQKGGGGMDMNALLKAMGGTNQGSNTEQTQKQERPEEPPQPLYDTNPQYLTRFYEPGFKDSAKTARPADDSQKTNRQKLDDMMKDYKEKGANTQNANPGSGGNEGGGTNNAGTMKLLADMMSGNKPDPAALMSLMGQNGGGMNPMMLMPLMQNMGGKKESKATAASHSPDANLTKPIEPFAPSGIVLNIRRMMSR